MTIDNARTYLWEWFGKKDIFLLERDAGSLVWLVESDEQEEERNAALIGALEDFVSGGMVKKVSYADKEYYILDKPFESLDQTITINQHTAGQVALTINNFCEAIGDRTDWADQGNLGEKDVRSLVAITSILESKLNGGKDLS